MKLEDQVVSLELAKKLKELGVKQESLFYRFPGEGHQYIFCKYYEQYSPNVDLDINDGYSAFTASELMELLPAFIDTKSNEPFNSFYINIQKRTALNIQYIINYHCDAINFEPGVPFMGIPLVKHNIYDEKLEDALAKMLIYLIENNLLLKEESK